MADAISTHTSHAGRDGMVVAGVYADEGISTHTSHAGRDPGDRDYDAGPDRFLLTRPMRDVTEERSFSLHGTAISTHTSHAGRDRPAAAGGGERHHFYSHVPCGT